MRLRLVAPGVACDRSGRYWRRDTDRWVQDDRADPGRGQARRAGRARSRGDLAAAARSMSADELAVSHMHLVDAIANSLVRRLPAHLERDELRGAGMVALVEAANRYQPARGPFLSFAWTRISGAMRDHLRREMPMSRAEAKAGGAYVGHGKRRRLCAGATRQVVSLDAETAHRDEDAATLTLADTIPDPRDDHAVRERLLDVAEALEQLTGRERLVLQARALDYDGVRIGSLLGVSESRVSQIATSATVKLRKAAA